MITETRDAKASTAGPAAETKLTTWTGFPFRVRPVGPEDRAAISELFENVSLEDRRLRFLSPIQKLDRDLLNRMTEVDHDRTENFLAFHRDLLVASAMLAADQSGERAEVAISIRADHKHRGIGWALLDHVAREAEKKGIKLIESIESRDNVEAISLEKEMGFTATNYPGDSTLVLLQKRLP